jgi:enoyl-[acyl-carrier protein] reductase I
VSYYGAEKVADNDNIMGPAKTALEAAARSMAVELGPKGIRVNACRPVHSGPGQPRDRTLRRTPSTPEYLSIGSSISMM